MLAKSSNAVFVWEIYIHTTPSFGYSIMYLAWRIQQSRNSVVICWQQGILWWYLLYFQQEEGERSTSQGRVRHFTGKKEKRVESHLVWVLWLSLYLIVVAWCHHQFFILHLTCLHPPQDIEFYFHHPHLHSFWMVDSSITLFKVHLDTKVLPPISNATLVGYPPRDSILSNPSKKPWEAFTTGTTWRWEFVFSSPVKNVCFIKVRPPICFCCFFRCFDLQVPWNKC